ncbi:hypothetical protein D3C72_1724550 [compost metagenome]
MHDNGELFAALAVRIDEARRIAEAVLVEVGTLLLACRIAGRPSPEPRRVIPRPVVVQPALLILLLAGIPIPFRCLGLAAYGLIGRTTVGCVFLVGNDLRLFIQFQAG